MSVAAGSPERPVRQHLRLGFRFGITEAEPHREAVELGLGQRVGALKFDRVLGCDHHERGFEGAAFAVARNLMFAHALQQRGLGARRGAVDFVGEQDVREHRAGAELEAALFRAVDVRADDVGGQQVGRELHPPEIRVDQPGQRLRQRGLADAGHVVEQHVAARNECGQQMADHLRLAANDPVEFVFDPVQFFNGVAHGKCPVFKIGYQNQSASKLNVPVSRAFQLALVRS